MSKSTNKTTKKNLIASSQTKKISDFFGKQSTSKVSTNHLKSKENDDIIFETPTKESTKRKHFGDGEGDVLDNITNTIPNHVINKKVKLNETETNGFKETSLISPDKKGSTVNINRSSPIEQNFNISSEDCIEATPENVIKKSKGLLTKGKSPGKKTPQKKTPVKNRTPVKLFSKSPNKLNEFNVEIINNFVKVTPSKSETSQKIETPSKSCEKKQKSILDYASPTASRSSAKAQLKNEYTPIRDNMHKKVETPSSSKFKVKLNFSDEVPSTANACKVKEKFSPNISFNADDFEDILFEQEWLEEMDPNQFTLDLTTSQHCKVNQVDKFLSKIQIVIESTKTKEKALCNLENFWMNMNITKGDTIHIKAAKTNSAEWTVNNEEGFIVYEPDILISSTTIVNSVFCKRKAVLQDRFGGFDAGNKFMMIGILVHELLEKVLKQNLRTSKSIENALNTILYSNYMLHSFYKNMLEIDDIKEDIQQFVPKIVEFVDHYVKNPERQLGVSSSRNKQNWNGRIDSIQDIEENFWNPTLGIKGKVDVTVQVGAKAMPLELKTGRATMSLEHRGQVMLYLMMMKDFGYNVNSGLLLYLREGVLKEVTINHKEQRDLIILRNDLSYYLSRKPIVKENHINVPELPEPINHHSACGNCEYKEICCSHLIHENRDLANNKKLQIVKEEILSYLQPSHIDYFMHWSNLLQVEFAIKDKGKSVTDIYTMSPEERQKRGKCITNVYIHEIKEENKEYYYTTFKKISTDEEKINLLTSGINESNYVVVSCDKRSAIAAGLVTCIEADFVTLALDRNINIKYKNHTFHLDTYDSNIVLTFNLANLGLLLQNNKKSEQLRKLIIDKEAPTYQQKLSKSIVTKCVPYLKGLNKIQQKAIIKVLTTNDYLLIKGMPGTGKTATLVALIELLCALNYTVLITSHTHSAVDNICLRLKTKGVDFLRLGLKGRMHPELRSHCEYKLTEHCKTTQELDVVYNKANVVAVTCLGASHPLLLRRSFDVCLVDESTQVLQPSVMKVLSSANKFILIGDPEQLPPLVLSPIALEHGLSQSLFERLCNKENTITLAYNYRMNEAITNLANKVTYEDQLLIGSDKVKNATIEIPQRENIPKLYSECEWTTKVFSNKMSDSVQVINTGCVSNLNYSISWLTKVKSNNEQKDTAGRCMNPYETSIVVTLAKLLLKCGVPSNNIGVISPYTLQVAQISYFLHPHNIEVNTIDQYQGRDKEIIIYSTTRSSSQSDVDMGSILNDKRRLTVAITRAKHKLIIVTDMKALQQYEPFENLFSKIDTDNIISTEDKSMNFDWQALFNFDEIEM